MAIPEKISSFWTEFEAELGRDVSSRFYEAFHFDDNEKSANGLLELVLAGTKRATASLVWAYEAEKAPLPKVGNLSVVTDWPGRPACVIETTIVEVVSFESVTDRFAAIEGEGDGSLRYWREVHWACFGRECLRIGREPSLQMPVVCEQFDVIYRSRD